MAHLTEAERQTLNDAMDIILGHTNRGASWQIYAAHYPSGLNNSLCYFDSEGGQHSSIYAETFAGCVENALAAESRAKRNSAEIRNLRIEALRKQLADLTGEPA
jgi:hypothetical protein